MHRPARSLANITMTLLLAACSAPAVSAPASSRTAESPESQLPSAEPSATTASQAPAPSAAPAPSQRPSSRPPATWSAPQVIRRGECSNLAATIDETGRRHVAAVCDGGIRYLTSLNGTDWDETPFVPAIDRIETEPQIAVDGDTIHVAYSLLAPLEGACGDPGLRDLGVYVRSRSRQRPHAAWSDPVRIGREGDRLQSFRAVDGVFHLTVTANDGESIFYQAQSSRGSTRIAIPGATSTSLRVGDDGHARIAYATGHAIEYARVEGDRLAVRTVAKTDETFLKSPSLVLGGGDRAYVIWTQTTDSGGGCVGPEPGPLDGTYVAIQDGPRWDTERITPSVWESGTSLTLDPATGGVDAVVAGPSLIHFSTTGTNWSSETIPSSDHMIWPVLRRDPASGALVVFGISETRVVGLTKS
jgi:hypothetical protein